MIGDIRFAIRLFRRERGLFAVTLAGLALAIGVSTAVFTVLNALAFRGFGVADAASVFRASLDNRLMGPVSRGGLMSGVWSYDDYARLAESPTSFAAAASATSGATLREAPDERVDKAIGFPAVSGTYFAVMGTTAARGRLIAPADDRPGAPPVIVLSHAFWMRRFEGDPSVVGRFLWLNGTRCLVVGVAARFFTGPTDGGTPPPLWVSLSTERILAAERPYTGAAERWNPPVTVHLRPAPGVSLAQAASEAGTLATAFAAERGQSPRPDHAVVRFESVAEREAAQASLNGRVVALVAGAIALVILLASANLANLLLAGAVRRGREISTRLALGAGRWRIVRQLVVEGVLLGCLGSIAGFVLAMWLTPFFARLGWTNSERLDLDPDFRTYLFAAVVALVVGVAAALAPALYSRRGDLVSALKSDRAMPSGHASRNLLRSFLIAGQSAAAIVLLVAAGLLTRAAVHAASFDLGFDADHLIEVSVGLSGGYDQARIDEYWRTALDRIRQLPGVAAAAVTESQPFSAYGPQRWQGGRIGFRETTSAEYFDAIGLRMLRGRTYTEDEIRSHAQVAVISASVARTYWGGADPIGGDLERVWGAPDTAATRTGSVLRKPAGTRVIGVVADTITMLDSYDAATVYMPAETLHANTQLVVRSVGNPTDTIAPVRDVLRSIDATQHPDFFLIRDRFQKQLEPPRRLAQLSSVIGLTALSLAAIGLFGVTAFVGGQRRREIGVRMTLGAERSQIARMLVRDSLRPVIAGLACGMIAALWVGRLLQSALYGLSGWDPIAIGLGVAVLLAAATAAAYLPAKRAALVDPAIVLRAE